MLINCSEVLGDVNMYRSDYRHDTSDTNIHYAVWCDCVVSCDGVVLECGMRVWCKGVV